MQSRAPKRDERDERDEREFAFKDSYPAQGRKDWAATIVGVAEYLCVLVVASILFAHC